MILTDEELQAIRQSLETYSHLDEELKRRCQHLLHLGANDEAVRTAFVLLEERLKDATGQDGMTGSKLADYAFNATNGPLSKHIGQTPVEREGLRELFAGAFKLFRNSVRFVPYRSSNPMQAKTRTADQSQRRCR